MKGDPSPHGAGAADIYLSVVLKRAGKVKGESAAPEHADDIIVRSWNWGVISPSDVATGAASGKRSYKHLVVTKWIDTASTALLSALAGNELATEVKLTMRKSGGDALDYYRMTLNKARVAAVDVEVDADGLAVEKVAFAFQTIEIEYKQQAGSGSRGASYCFVDNWLDS